MKKVLMFHQGADLYGSDKIFLLVASEIAKSNSVRVILDSSGPLVKKLLDSGVDDVIIRDLAVLRRKRFQGVFSSLCYLVSFLRASLGVFYEIKSFKPDFVYVNTLAVISPVFVSLFFCCKVIHHIHEIQSRPRILMRILYTASCVASDSVLCVSQSVKRFCDDMSYFKTNNTKVIYNGIPIINVSEKERNELWLELNSSFENGGLPLIAYVARIHSWKGQLEFIDVMNFLVNDLGFKANVAFFGDVFPGYEMIKDKLEEKVLNLGLEKYIKFFGYRADAAVLFSVADVSVMGSIDPDPLPTVVLESMQQGTPVIAYAHGGSCEMINDGVSGILVPPLDTRAMASEIRSILLCDDRRRNMGKAAKLEFANRFSYDSFVNNILKSFS